VRDLKNFKWRAAGFEAWLFRIAGNLVIDHIRKSSRRPATVEIRDDHSIESATPESSALAGELTQEIANMLETLPPDQREVLLLRFAGGLNTEETAVVMDRKPNAVRQLQFRALGRLRETMPQRVTR
jgi:RNA polymerase sigma-70 factor (ECF subfamily)